MATYTRRGVLETMAIAGSVLFWPHLVAPTGLAQDQSPMPTPRVRTPVNPPDPAEKQDKDVPAGLTRGVSLQAQEKELRTTLDQLLLKVSDLKGQLDQMHAAEVFSVAVFKQTQEIEKLAKRLKNCARS